MRVLLFGPPGSGKGTQGERLVARLGVAHISTGDLLRAEVRAGTDLGGRVSRLLDRGELVPDETMFELVWPRVRAAAAAGGYVLDGYPRSVEQARMAEQRAAHEDVAPNAAVYLDVERDELKRRILARAAEQGRADDNAETVATRLRVFDSSTRPLVDHYRRHGLLRVVDANAGADTVETAVLAALGVGRD